MHAESRSSADRFGRPSIRCTTLFVSPPFFHVIVPRDTAAVVMSHCAQPAPEPRIDESTHLGRLPLHVLVVHPVGSIHLQQIRRQVTWRPEVVDVYEGVWRSDLFVLRFSSAHHYWNHVIPA